MSLDLGGQAIDERLREASRKAGALRPELRLETKIELGAAGVAARLQQASQLLDLCRALAKANTERSGIIGVAEQSDSSDAEVRGAGRAK
jgi:hypothetical protein